MARTSSRDNGDLWRAARSSVNDLVLGVKRDGRIGQSDCPQRRKNQMARVVDKVSCCLQLATDLYRHCDELKYQT